MAGVNQTSEGTWRIVDLCTHETENVYNLSIPIKLTYGGKSVDFPNYVPTCDNKYISFKAFSEIWYKFAK